MIEKYNFKGGNMVNPEMADEVDIAFKAMVYKERQILTEKLKDEKFLDLTKKIQILVTEILSNKKRINMIKNKVEPYNDKFMPSELLISGMEKLITHDTLEIGKLTVKLLFNDFEFSEEDKKFLSESDIL